MKKNAAILGSGNIGTDLLVKIQRSPYLTCSLFIGRRLDSPGMAKARDLGVKVSDASIDAIMSDPDCCDIVFDATSARDHLLHWSKLKNIRKLVVDMTPSNIGTKIIPAVNVRDIEENKNINMVSCGGQASIPLIYAIATVQTGIEYIEVVSSISSKSAGPGTRINIDEYIENTEEAIRIYSGCKNAKVILILNPAEPSIDMQTTISVKIKNPDMEKVKRSVYEMEQKIQSYVPGYKIVVPPIYETNRIVVMVRVRGLGDYLPSYAGNLDIINCAAIAAAEEYVINNCF